MMTTKDVVQVYFTKVKEKSDWQSLIAEEMKFESPSSTSVGREAYVMAASHFFQMAESFEVRSLVAEGEKVCAWVDYALHSESGKHSNCLVSQLFEVRNNKIVSSVILWDTLALVTFALQD